MMIGNRFDFLRNLNFPRFCPVPVRHDPVHRGLLAFRIRDRVALVHGFRLVPRALHDFMARRACMLGIGDEGPAQVVEDQAAIFSACSALALKSAEAEFCAAIVPDAAEVADGTAMPIADEWTPGGTLQKARLKHRHAA